MSTSGLYAFRAARPNGIVERGRIEGESERSAAAGLLDLGLLPLEIRYLGPQNLHRRRASTADMALGLGLLADLLESGIPVGRALHAFESLAPKSWQPAIPHLRESVRQGNSMATALATAPIEIPALVIGIARAGEAGSGLPGALRRAAEVTERAAESAAALRSSLAYPAVLAVAGTGSIGMLVGVVLPRFAAILSDLDQQLPPATRLVMAAAGLARRYSAAAAILIVVALLVWRSWVATSSGRTTWHALLLRSPGVGPLRLSLGTARMLAALAALLDSGIPLSEALRHAAAASGDSEMERRALAARGTITRGTTLAQALEAEGAVTAAAVRLIRAGDETGRLVPLLVRAAATEQTRASRAVATGLRMLEPVLILGFALVVAFVAAALLQAVYSIRPGP